MREKNSGDIATYHTIFEILQWFFIVHSIRRPAIKFWHMDSWSIYTTTMTKFGVAFMVHVFINIYIFLSNTNNNAHDDVNVLQITTATCSFIYLLGFIYTNIYNNRTNMQL